MNIQDHSNQPVTVYFGCALTNAPDIFRKAMLNLRNSLETERIQVLKFAWIDGKGPPEGVNTYENDMNHIAAADLAVFVADEPSSGLGMEIQERARLHLPLLCFVHEESRISKIIPDCPEHFRRQCGPDVLSEPKRYRNVSEIRFEIVKWVEECIRFRYLEAESERWRGQQIHLDFAGFCLAAGK